MDTPCAMIFGASGVLGGAMVRAFQEKGHRVLGSGFQRAPSVRPSIQFDATQGTEVKRMEQWLLEQTDRVDVVVHCIGANQDDVVARMDERRWKSILDINLKSAALISTSLIPRLAKQRHGHLIFIGSWAGRVGREGQPNYAAAKAGLIGLTQSIAREYGGRNIQANCVVPGVFLSPMTGSLTSTALESLWDGSVTRQFADMDETARFVAHLAVMKGVTGQVFQLDGRIAPAF